MNPTDDRDATLLDELGLSLAAEQELEHGADLVAVRARLLEAALDESSMAPDTEAPELMVAPVVALAERDTYDSGPSLWLSSARTSLMAMGALFLVLVLGGGAFMLTKLKVNNAPLIGSRMRVGPEGWAISVDRQATPGKPGIIRVRGASAVRSTFPVKRRSGNTFEVWVPVALGTTDRSVSVEMKLVDHEGVVRPQSVEVPIVAGGEPPVRRLRVDPDELMRSKAQRHDERLMLEAKMAKGASFEAGRPLDDAFLWPIAGSEDDISSDFGELRVFSRTNEAGEDIVTVFDRHLGVDVRGPRGAPVVAAQRGWVMASEHLRHGGVTVVLQHRQGVYSVYQHLEASEVTPRVMWWTAASALAPTAPRGPPAGRMFTSASGRAARGSIPRPSPSRRARQGTPAADCPSSTVMRTASLGACAFVTAA
jgi:hypothetical protein